MRLALVLGRTEERFEGAVERFVLVNAETDVGVGEFLFEVFGFVGEVELEFVVHCGNYLVLLWLYFQLTGR